MRITLACAMFAVSAAHGQSVFLVGNSLTNDTSPAYLDGNATYRIDCSKNLVYIRDHPDTETCVAGSEPLGDALALPHDWLTVQPYVGTTLAEDAAVVSEWMNMQPTATFIVHTGWPPSASFETTYHGAWDGVTMTHTPAYFDALAAELSALHPGRTIVSTEMLDILDGIHHDIERGVAPYAALSDLYRDPLHLQYNDGYFLAHNAMRRALGQPFRLDRFGVPSDRQRYLLAAIERCPADYDRDRDADVFDILAYLDDWFSGGGDIFALLDFLTIWFGGC